MVLKEINFEALQPVRRKYITFAKDGNKVVKPYKTLYCLEQITENPAHKDLYIKVVHGKESWEKDSYCVFEDLGEICNKVGWINRWWTLEKTTEQLEQYPYLGKEGLLKRLKESEENGYYINKVDIELCFILGETELARHYAEYREKKVAEREQKAKAEQAEREAREKEEEATRLAEIEKTISDVENAIREHKTVYNEEIHGSTVILRIFKKYGVNVPLKTQGWINNALGSVTYEGNGRIKYTYCRSSKNSTVFCNYFQELAEKILAACV